MSPQRQPTREAGICPVCGAASASKFGVYCEDHKAAGERPPLEEWFTPQEIDTTAAAPPPDDAGEPDSWPGPEPAAAAETAPASPHARPPSSPPSMGNGGGGRLRRLLARARSQPKETRAPKEQKARRPAFSMRNRVSTADDATELYGQVAGRVALSRHYPAGRMMQWQAPMFGVVFDNAIAGTVVDRLAAQPLMRQKAKWEPLADLVVPPVLLVGMKNALDAGNMNAFNAMAPILEYSIDRHLLSIAPAAAQARAEAAAKEAVVAEAFPEWAGAETPSGQPLSPAQALIATLFAEPQWAAATDAGASDTETEAAANGKTVQSDPFADSQSPMG